MVDTTERLKSNKNKYNSSFSSALNFSRSQTRVHQLRMAVDGFDGVLCLKPCSGGKGRSTLRVFLTNLIFLGIDLGIF